MARWFGKALSGRRRQSRLRDLGDAARDRGEWLQAVDHYRAYLDHHPDHFPIWVQLGHVSKESGDPRGAEEAYGRALQLQPRDADLLLNMGHLFKALGRTDEAIEHYQRSAVTDPTGNAHRELALLGQRLTAEQDKAGVEAPIFTEGVEPSLFLKGVVDVPASHDGPVRVMLAENAEMLDWTVAKGEGRRRAFAIRLPADVCDGRPHAFEIAAEETVISRLATITPTALTPLSILQDYAGRGLRSRLSVAAAHRYTALAERLAQSPDAEAAATYTVAHRFLVEGPVRVGLQRSYVPLTLDVSAAPRVSIVIPVHDKFDYTYRCLASLVLMPNATPFEVIIVDDGSSDQTVEIEALARGVRVIRHEEARGFVHACNAGAAAALGDYVLLLNNDTEVTPHWLDRLLEPFDHYDDVGLVGAKLIYGDGRLQEAGGIVWNNGAAWNYGRLGNARDPRYNFLREADYCSGACVVAPTSLWRELRGFDPSFAPAYFEDTDLAFRVRAAGKRVLYQSLAEVMHFEGVSNGQDLTTGFKRYQAINEPKFRERWSAAYSQHGEQGARGVRDLERTYDRQALVIDVEVPQPDRSAGAHAAIQEIRLLQSLGYRVTFLPLNLAYLGKYNDLLASLGVECVQAPFVLSAEEFLEGRAGDFDLIYITRYSVAAEMMDMVRRHNPGAPVVFNNADLHFLRAIRDALDAGGEGQLIADAEAVRDAELAVIEAADLTLSYNVVEHAVIESHTLGRAKVALCPWVVEPRPEAPGYLERHGIAFLGGYRHPPNRRAVEYFVEEIMPEIRRRRPGMTFHIYGSSVPPDFARFAAPDVVIEGFVESVDQALDRSRVFVAPLTSGAGIKGKVLEALASGIPSILSPIAAEGIGLRDGTEALIATSPTAWADAIVSLYDDAQRWAEIGAAGRRYVEENHSFARGRDVLRRAFEQHGIPTGEGWTSRTVPPLRDW